MSASLHDLLARLDKVEKLTPGSHAARYRACCPAHADTSPSLSVTETQNGTILLKCWAGCSAHEIVGALGMTMSDLFPKTEQHHVRGNRRAFNASDAIATVARDALVVACAAAKLRSGEQLSTEDMDALVKAAGRCGRIAEEVL